MNCKLLPLFARVLRRREKFASRSGSITIPADVAKRNAPPKGTVLAVGKGCSERIKPGRVVIIGQYAGSWINADGLLIPRDSGEAPPDEIELFVCQDEDIIAEVKE